MDANKTKSGLLTVLQGDVRERLAELPASSVHCVVTSPPYWGLRSYLPEGHPLKHLEIGSEQTLDCGVRVKGSASRGECGECYVCHLLAVFRELWRVLRDDGTVWLNLGDTYAGGKSGRDDSTYRDGLDQFGHGGGKKAKGTNNNGQARDLPSGFKAKDLCMVPFRVALALQAEGWYVRSDIVWAKPNCMPESVTDRPTRSHEFIFLLTKSPRYFYDAEAIREPAIYDVDGTGTAARKARAQEGDKGFPTAERNGMRPELGILQKETKETKTGRHQLFSRDHPESSLDSKFKSAGYKNSVNFEGKNSGKEKQRGHSRRHSGFNDRWDKMSHEEQCVGMRNKRDVWFVSPACYPEAHFATFPKELITPCILAGTSAGGCCGRCGAPLKRKVEDGELRTEQQRACGGDRNGEYHGESTKGHAEKGVQDASAVKARVLAGMRERITTGWERGCECKAESEKAKSGNVVPCVVLDPFGGSGTTGEVAMELGRRAVLIELNSEYLPLIERRTKTVTPGIPGI